MERYFHPHPPNVMTMMMMMMMMMMTPHSSKVRYGQRAHTHTEWTLVLRSSAGQKKALPLLLYRYQLLHAS